ncbi:MAG: 3-deoxy-D-manno-octulosonate 8-phosphate phosphatase [Bacteroidia bacterium]|nr:3-deoxy-D-manno-octulosonate 8-phosphate phosphatase [Bacteroidia bacterium]
MSNFKEDLPHIKAFVFDIDGVLSTNSIPLNTNGEPMRMANIKDGYALQLAVKYGYKIAIITGADTESIRIRYSKLNIEDIYLSSSIKKIDYQAFKNKYKFDDSEILYMGDDIPDIPVLRLVGISTCPADAAVEVKDISKYISLYKGGEGCVRDVIEQVMKAQGNWMKNEHAFGW